MNNAFLEIGTEHLPSRFVKPALQQMEALATALLTEKRIGYKSVQAFGTYRRLALLIEEISDKSADVQKEVKGPPAKLLKDASGNFTAQSAGFAQKNGVTPEDLVIKDTDKGPFIYADVNIKGDKTFNLLPEIFSQIILKMEFAKNMIWEPTGLRWGRPIRTLIGLYGSRVVKFEVAGVTANRFTYPQSSFGRKPIRVESADFDAYVALLKNQPQPILVLPEDRREALLRSVMNEAKVRGYHAELDPALIEETVYFTEHPIAVGGDFDLKFLTLPKELITTVLKKQIKMFPVVDKNNEIQPYFIAVRDGISANQMEVRDGFKKVMSARLSDAVFFFENDKKAGLDTFKNKLAGVNFLDGVGSMLEKSDRVRDLALWLCNALGKPELKDDVAYAAGYAYADLTSSVVYEFPELQGYMGGQYAALAGYPEPGKAMEEFYFPLSSNSDLPSTTAGNIVSLAGKMDTLVGNFLIGQIPTGSEDPFALRRQAFGIVRILLENSFKVSVADLLRQSVALYPQVGSADNLALLPAFLLQRVALVLEQKGHNPSTMSAVIGWVEMPLSEIETLVSALEKCRESADFQKAAEAAKRVCNILKKAGDVSESVDEKLFELDAEKELYNQIQKINSELTCMAKECLVFEDYAGVLKKFGAFAAPLEKFFTDVMVNVPDEAVRNNRLALLARVRRFLTQLVADITKL